MPSLAPRRSTLSAAAALLLIGPAASAGIYFGFHKNAGSLGIVAWMLAKVWLFGMPLLWVMLVDREPPGVSKPKAGGFGVSLLLGLVMAGAIAAAYFAVGRSHIEPADLRTILEPLHLTNPAVYIAAAAYWIFVNSVLEEYVFRWFIFTRAERLMPGWAAVLLSAAIFVVHHTLAMAAYFSVTLNTLASLGIFLAALVWSALYHRYRSVWIPWIAHACADLAIFTIGWFLLFR